MTITTQDCKQELIQQYPQTKASEWKRIKKTKDTHGVIVREFSHPQYPSVCIFEHQGQLSRTHPIQSINTQPMAPNGVSFVIYRYQTTDTTYNVYFCHPQYDDDDFGSIVHQYLSPLFISDTLLELDAPHYHCDGAHVTQLYQQLVQAGFCYDGSLVNNQYDVFNINTYNSPTKNQAPGNQLTIFQYLSAEQQHPLNASSQQHALQTLQSLPLKDLTGICNMFAMMTIAPQSWLQAEIMKEYQDRIHNPNKPRNIVNTNMSDIIKRRLGL